MKLTRNEVMLLRGALYTKRMYKGMKHIPHGAVVWEDWMEDSLVKVNKYIKEHYPDMPDWK
tara:strand:- start:136 stop:318 length:183 start_codon:yes stop_codon:yes gene_type:complete